MSAKVKDKIIISAFLLLAITLGFYIVRKNRNSLKFSKLSRKIILVTGNKSDLSKLFIRMMSYVDSSTFRGQSFSLAQIECFYNNFDYYTTFAGFNVSCDVIKEFKSGKFDPLSDAETWLLKNIDLHHDDLDSKYFIIGCCCGYHETYIHETCHALYFLSAEYKNEVDEVLKEFELIKSCDSLLQYLIDLKYHQDVFSDEIQACLIASKQKLIGIWHQEWDSFRERLILIYGKYIGDIVGTD